MNVITDIQELKDLQRKYFKVPKWKKKRLIYGILDIIEQMEVPKVIEIPERMEKN